MGGASGRQGTMVHVRAAHAPGTRTAWCALSGEERRRILRALRANEVITDERLRRAASGWAEDVLRHHAAARPERRKGLALTVLWVLAEAVTGPAGAAAAGSIYSGEPGYDFLPAVRRMAERTRAHVGRPGPAA